MFAKKDQVIMVDENDRLLGTMDKVEVHKKGLLHRAFSVFIVNSSNELLLQQRAFGKYHSGGLWSNTCCSHPMPGEDTMTAAHRRLQEEMGFDCGLQHMFSFIYRADVGNGLVENELDHVFTGMYDGPVNPDTTEVNAYQYIPLHQLQPLMLSDPDNFSAWLHIAMPRLASHLNTGITARQH
jgi:isopentenyl-diphosphate delta-isomerase